MQALIEKNFSCRIAPAGKAGLQVLQRVDEGGNELLFPRHHAGQMERLVVVDLAVERA